MNFQAFFAVLSLLGSVYALIITVFLAMRLTKTAPAQILLFIIFLHITIVMFLITGVNTGWLKEIVWLDKLEKALTLSSGPCVLAFTITRVKILETLPKLFFLHFIPPVFYILLASNNYEWRFLYNMIHFQLYIILSIFIYLQYRIKNKRKDRSGVEWVSLLLTCLVVICIAQWLRWFWQELPSLRLIVPFVSSVSLQILLFTGFRYSHFMCNNITISSKVISTDFATQKLTMLIQLMEQEQLYRRTDLTLGHVANRLNIPANQLSLLLNQHLKISLADYLNTYRIKKAQELLLDPDKSNFTIAALAQESGFKSRSAFYAAFKKQTGMTPTAYQKLSGISFSGQASCLINDRKRGLPLFL